MKNKIIMNVYNFLVFASAFLFQPTIASKFFSNDSQGEYVYNIFYWNVPPLIKYNQNNGEVLGIIPDIFKEIQARCVESSNTNNDSSSQKFIKYHLLASEKEMFDVMSNLTKIELQGTVWGPFLTNYLNNEEVIQFCSKNNIIQKKLVEMDGMAVIVPRKKLYILNKIVAGLLQLIKMYSLFLATCVISGLIFWLIDQSHSPETASLKGIISSIWWAFITMTTVGYGDVVPKTKIGRLFAVAWMYYAMIVFCIVTGIVTNLVFSDELFDISDKEVAVLKDSYEDLIGENTFNVKHLYYKSYDEVLDAVKTDKDVFAGLVPGSIAGWRQNDIDDLGLSVVAIHHLSTYTFLLELNNNFIDDSTDIGKVRKVCHQNSFEYIYKAIVKGNYEKLLESRVYLIHPFKHIFKFEHVYVTMIVVLVFGAIMVSIGLLKDKISERTT